MHFSYIKPSPIKNNECNLRDVREIQIILQQYRAVRTKLVIFLYKCMYKVSTHATCKSVHVHDFLYLRGSVVYHVVSFPQFSHAICCSVGEKIFQ